MCGACIAERLDRINWPHWGKIAHRPVVGTKLNWSYFNFKQMQAVMEDKHRKVSDLRLTVFNHKKMILNLLDRAAITADVMKCIATGDVKRVHAHLAQSLKRGESPRKILERLTKAAAGALRTNGFSQAELDVSKIVLRIGGPRLLHAVAAELQLPSIPTVRRIARQLPCFISTTHLDTLYDDVLANVSAFFNSIDKLSTSASASSSELLLILLAVDETKLREAVRFHHRTNRILGTCFEHAYGFGNGISWNLLSPS